MTLLRALILMYMDKGLFGIAVALDLAHMFGYGGLIVLAVYYWRARKQTDEDIKEDKGEQKTGDGSVVP